MTVQKPAAIVLANTCFPTWVSVPSPTFITMRGNIFSARIHRNKYSHAVPGSFRVKKRQCWFFFHLSLLLPLFVFLSLPITHTFQKSLNSDVHVECFSLLRPGIATDYLDMRPNRLGGRNHGFPFLSRLEIRDLVIWKEHVSRIRVNFRVNAFPVVWDSLPPLLSCIVPGTHYL